MRPELPRDAGVPADPTASPQHAEPVHAGAASDRRRFDSHQLFGSGQEVEIAHAGAIYRLRRTALGKLILTK